MKYLILLIPVLMFYSCAPVFSELQTARTVGKNNFEITPSYSSVGFTSNGESDRVQNHAGLQFAYGIHDRWDLRLRYEYLWLSEDFGSDGVSIVGVGPKYSILENRISFYLPIGRAFGEGYEDSWQTHPTLLITRPLLEEKIDFYFAPKYILTFCSNCDDLVAINMGFGLSSKMYKWSIKPEYGMLFNPGKYGFYNHFSIGFSKSI